jgi:hypothetical protein
MTTCATCAHWTPRDPGEIQRRMAKVKMAICALGPRWVFLDATKTCPRHAPASAEICEARAKWLAKAK